MEQEANENHGKFIERLVRLNDEMKELFAGDLTRFSEMNRTIKEMYALQHGQDDEAFRAIVPECEVIYANFDMIIGVLRTTDGTVDEAARRAIDKFLHNIAEAVVNVAAMFGLI